jgi:OOP family OmpA-OmpF porin
VLSEPGATLAIPTGPFRDGALPTRPRDGLVSTRAWRLDSEALTTLDLLTALSAQLAAEGWTVGFSCDTADCGGFDFRYGLALLPEPDMHVDLGDFRFLAADRGAGESLIVLVSRSARAGFVQITQVAAVAPAALAQSGTEEDESGEPETLRNLPRPVAPGLSGLSGKLAQDGHAVLEDLVFEPGSAALAAGEFASLSELADWLRTNPDLRLLLVGHTDASGGLDANTALSRRRAEAVRQALISAHGVAPDRLSAEGAGYLAPRASNATDAGRALNRRVEAVVTGP